jgi:hypothetical protein
MLWCSAFFIVWLQALFVGFLSHQALHMLIGPWRISGFWESILQKYFWTKKMVRAAIVILAIGFGAFALHLFLPQPWNVVVAVFSSLAVIAAGWTALAGVILRVIWAAKQRRIAEREDPFAISNRPLAASAGKSLG